MSTEASAFALLITRLRAGNEQAAAELVAEYGPEIRRFVRFRLSSPALRRVFDSLDVCQSVLCKFFVHLSEGSLKLDNPEQLRALLLTMARNKLYDRVRHERAKKRDDRMIAHGDEALLAVADSADSPSELFAVEEVLAAVRNQLSEDDNYLVEERMAGRGWDDLATELNASPDALRKRMTRALDTVANRLGLRSD